MSAPASLAPSRVAPLSSGVPLYHAAPIVKQLNVTWGYHKLYIICRFIRQQNLTKEEGKTGKVQFSEDGDRTNPIYKIINKQSKGLVTVGNYGVTGVSFMFGTYNIY